jgi:uncharacterized membrane protein YeiB
MIAGAAAGLVAWLLLRDASHAALTWVLAILGVAAVAAVAVHNGAHLADMRKDEWLQRADRLDAEPPSPVADTHLRAGLVEADRDEHVTRLNPEDDEAIRRA